MGLPGGAWARWPSRSSKPVRSCNPRLGRFDSCAPPLSKIPLVQPDCGPPEAPEPLPLSTARHRWKPPETGPTGPRMARTERRRQVMCPRARRSEHAADGVAWLVPHAGASCCARIRSHRFSCSRRDTHAHAQRSGTNANVSAGATNSVSRFSLVNRSEGPRIASTAT
jgi:hypothetical protein